jgi:hypothetical protein
MESPWDWKMVDARDIHLVDSMERSMVQILVGMMAGTKDLSKVK